jgi:hypothetical protein
MNISELAKFRGGVSADTISELTSASGVTIDGLLIKDSGIQETGTVISDGSANAALAVESGGGLNLTGNSSTSAMASGKIGQMFGTTRSGTNGDSASTRSATALLSTEAAVLSITLNKGKYLLSYIVTGYNPDATAGSVYTYVRIGGTAVTRQPRIAAPSGSRMVNGMYGIPIDIYADGTVVDVVAAMAGLVGTWGDADHEMWVVRRS